jgi:hypothetical protein
MYQKILRTLSIYQNQQVLKLPLFVVNQPCLLVNSLYFYSFHVC